jgi:TRAP transporter TAXI family solute receptor
MKSKILLVLAFMGGFAGGGTAHAAPEKLLVIGSGGVAGAYYPAAGAVASLINRNSGDSGLRVAVAPSPRASLDNVNGLLAGNLQLGLVQSDIQSQAINGLGSFANAQGTDRLRALFSLYSEAFTVVAARDSGITRFAELKGRRIAMGNPGASYRVTAEMFMREFGWSAADVRAAQDIAPEDMGQALCGGRADAFIYTIGHPYGMIRQAVSECGARIVSLEGPELQAFMDGHACYPPAEIPAGMYGAGNPRARTFGPKAVLTATSELSEDDAYFIVKTVVENFDAFKKMLPVFSGLTREEMAKGHSVPLHPGAARYFREAGSITR